MLTTSSTLIETARSASASPYVRVRLSDRDLGVPRLRFTRWYTGSEAEGPAGLALPSDGSLVRVRIDAATSTLYTQRIATPSASSDYSAWSSLATAEADAGVGLHAAGARVLVGYYDGTAVRVRESTDGGATFGTASALVFSADVTAVGCAVREDGAALAAWAAGDDLYVAARPAGGAWGSPAAWPYTLGGINAVAVSDTEDWAILVSGEDGDGAPGCWSTRYGSGVGGPPGDWSALAPVLLASPGLDVSYRATAVVDVGAPRALLVESYAGTGAFDRVMLATGLAGGAFEDGEWRDPVPFEHTSTWGLAAAAQDGRLPRSGRRPLARDRRRHAGRRDLGGALRALRGERTRGAPAAHARRVSPHRARRGADGRGRGGRVLARLRHGPPDWSTPPDASSGPPPSSGGAASWGSWPRGPSGVSRIGGRHGSPHRPPASRPSAPPRGRSRARAACASSSAARVPRSPRSHPALSCARANRARRRSRVSSRGYQTS
ncbi:MAG: hypothetical protein M0R75_16310 [Dehalococcoidia bacterium]|nr:hypothetical protein [Dehalococcoidia bacterium]